MLKEEIINQFRSAGNSFASYCTAIPDELFFRQPAEKWSIAQNIKHLITAANITRLAFVLPKFFVRLYTGKPNRPSRTYDELVNKYKLKLQNGGRASGIYIPKTISAIQGKARLINDFNKAMNKLVRAIESNASEKQLDRYLAPHPLLGKITLRELGYFTIYHTEHHLRIINDRLRDFNHPVSSI